MSQLQPESSDPHGQPQTDGLGRNDSSRYSVAECPICEAGLCSVRAFFETEGGHAGEKPAYGLILCDECEAIWFQPDVQGVHVYADSESPRCPVTGKPLYDEQSSRWANSEDVQALGWTDNIDHSLTHDPNHDA